MQSGWEESPPTQRAATLCSNGTNKLSFVVFSLLRGFGSPSEQVHSFGCCGLFIWLVFKIKINFSLMCMRYECSVCMYLSVLCVCAWCLRKLEKHIRSLETGVTEGC